MQNRKPNVRKRADGRWEGRFTEPGEEKGRRRSVYGKTRKEVLEKIKKATAAPTGGAEEQSSVTFDFLLQYWMEHYRIRRKGSTEMKYRFLIEKQILPELGSLPAEALTGERINRFLQGKSVSGRLDGSGGLSPASLRTLSFVITSALDLGAEEGLCPPRRGAVLKPPLKKTEIPTLSTDQQRRLEEALLQDPKEDRLAILLSLHTGLRIGEVCALTWEDVDFDRRILRITRTVSRVQAAGPGERSRLILDSPKTASSRRTIPLTEKIRFLLQEEKIRSKGAYVASGKDEILSPRTLESRYHALLRSCGIPKIKYHALRHTFATRCIEAGVDVKSLSEILGHANAAVTLNIYVHSSLERKRELLEQAFPDDSAGSKGSKNTKKGENIREIAK